MTANTLDSRLRELVVALKSDADEVEAAIVESPGQAIEHTWMSAGIRWAVNAIEVDLLGNAGQGGNA